MMNLVNLVLSFHPIISYQSKEFDNIRIGIRSDASTADSQPLTQVSNTAATTGLTSGFGMGPGRTLLLWPACYIV